MTPNKPNSSSRSASHAFSPGISVSASRKPPSANNTTEITLMRFFCLWTRRDRSLACCFLDGLRIVFLPEDAICNPYPTSCLM